MLLHYISRKKSGKKSGKKSAREDELEGVDGDPSTLISGNEPEDGKKKKKKGKGKKKKVSKSEKAMVSVILLK